MSPNLIDPKYDVFISYARADYKDENNKPIPDNVISKIVSAFKENDISYWIDEKEIHTGDDYSEIIIEAIKKSSVFVFVSTKNSNSSRWVEGEIRYAHKLQKPILPIICDDSEYNSRVLLDLIVLDHCDYQIDPDSAIDKLVKSVKEKLPKSLAHNEQNKLKGDLAYKEIIIKSLDQLVTVSHVAFSRILESNEQNMSELRHIAGDSINRLWESEEKHFDSLKSSILIHLNEISNTTKEELSEISSCVQRLRNDFVLSHNEYIEQQKKTNDLLEQLTSICFELSHKNQIIKNGQNYNNIISDVSKKKIANVFFVIDVSGSMVENIDSLNSSMKRFISDFNNNHQIAKHEEIHLSVLYYSTEAEWQYDTPINIDNYKWINLEVSGLTNIGNALEMLDTKLLEDVSESDFAPLIIFMTDGAPTDSYELKNASLSSNPIFKRSQRFCISIGPHAKKTTEHTNEIKVNDTSDLNSVIDGIMRIYLDIRYSTLIS